MRARAIGRLALAAAALALVLGASAPPAKIEGVWAFRTAPYREGTCVLSGTMTIQPTLSPENYTCTFVAFEVCEDLQARAEQTCTAKRSDSGVEISSTLKSVTPSLNYLPDDFVLDKISAARMEGLMLSAADAEVVFTRPNPAIS